MEVAPSESAPVSNALERNEDVAPTQNVHILSPMFEGTFAFSMASESVQNPETVALKFAEFSKCPKDAFTLQLSPKLADTNLAPSQIVYEYALVPTALNSLQVETIRAGARQLIKVTKSSPVINFSNGKPRITKVEAASFGEHTFTAQERTAVWYFTTNKKRTGSSGLHYIIRLVVFLFSSCFCLHTNRNLPAFCMLGICVVIIIQLQL
jgi:hypothetical protein